jgi:hypothetical protein
MTNGSEAALARLEPLIGRWKTEGWTLDESGAQDDRIDATDTYERLPGGALLHLVDAKVGEVKVDGAEIIGYDPEREGYASQYFGSEGLTAYENRLTEQGGATVWEMQSDTTRFRGVFSEDGGIIDGHWQLLGGDAGWRPWMNITLTKHGG